MYAFACLQNCWPWGTLLSALKTCMHLHTWALEQKLRGWGEKRRPMIIVAWGEVTRDWAWEMTSNKAWEVCGSGTKNMQWNMHDRQNSSPTLAPVVKHNWAKTRCKKKKNGAHTERSKTSAQGESPRWELEVVAWVAVSHFTCSPWIKQQNAN